ncbi:UDP-glucose 4-epimerase GalE [Rhizobium sp. RCC_161_2]|uniref:UDP-glucose 4-epimerase GalE n=1 Tax=Rhizobium sp. RCC_161_2 TaxID=3239219 RepID=UPI003524406F
MSMRNILVVGGAGFIGSHTAKLLRKQGYEPIVYDNLSTGHEESVRWGPLEKGDILDTQRLVEVLTKYSPDAVIHFAASAYVGESVEDPAKYYANNVNGTHSLLEACRRTGTDKLIFSSSCAIYGIPDHLPIREHQIPQPINPYGRTKLIAEHMLADYSAAYGLHYVALRYFNASGADPEQELGEWHDPETHLIPRALLAASGSIDFLQVYGDDYDTPDGTCIRDYIHVMDLARAHILAVEYLMRGGANLAVNLGTGHGTSIKEILTAIRRISRCPVPVEMRARRAGDPPALYAASGLAAEKLGFQPVYSNIETIIRTAAPFFGLEVHE